jgi:hypothetical protein
VADHAGPTADVALGYRTADLRRSDRTKDVFRSHVEAVDVIEQSVPGLTHDRQRPQPAAVCPVPRAVGDEGVADDAHAVGVRQADRPAELPCLADPLETRQLAIAVEAVTAREHRLVPDVAVVRQDHRDARAHRALADDQPTLPANERRVPDADATHIHDRIAGPCRQPADDESQVCPHLRRVPPPSDGHRPGCAMMPCAGPT